MGPQDSPYRFLASLAKPLWLDRGQENLCERFFFFKKKEKEKQRTGRKRRGDLSVHQ